MKAIVVFLMILCFPLLVNGDEVYRWVDDQGVIHFTDDPGTVPEDYRSKAEVREMPGRPPARLLDEEDEGILVNEEDEGILVDDDLKAKDEKWWRNRAKKWKIRLQAAYDDYERVRLQYNDMATEFNASKDPDKRNKIKAELDKMQMEMERFMADIEKARKMKEEVLPSQAQKAGKPLEWVR